MRLDPVTIRSIFQWIDYWENYSLIHGLRIDSMRLISSNVNLQRALTPLWNERRFWKSSPLLQVSLADYRRCSDRYLRALSLSIDLSLTGFSVCLGISILRNEVSIEKHGCLTLHLPAKEER